MPIRIALLACAALWATPALAWGDKGHQIIGHIAYGMLTPAARAKADALLAADKDPLTPPDFVSRAEWADVWRNAGDRKLHYAQTHLWHFVDLELSGPDLDAACHHFPPLKPGTLASNGPAADCLTAKVIQFQAELADPKLPAAERLMALKFVMNLVGDIEQPFHASDDHDDHGNCEYVLAKPGGERWQLHHYWDDAAVDDLIAADARRNPADDTLEKTAARLAGEIEPAEKALWQTGDAKDWSLQSFRAAKSIGYALPSRPACAAKPADYPAILLSAAYQARTQAAVRTELKQAGVRLALMLNTALK